jgi:hypothetical protein
MTTGGKRRAGAFRAGHLLVAIGALSCWTCGEAPSPNDLGPLAVKIVNDTQFDLLELRLHSALQDYADYPNIFRAPLPVDGSTLLTDVDPGTYYVTVFRRENFNAGARVIAVTSSELIAMTSGINEIWVYNESFRAWDPKKNDASGP